MRRSGAIFTEFPLASFHRPEALFALEKGLLFPSMRVKYEFIITHFPGFVNGYRSDLIAGPFSAFEAEVGKGQAHQLVDRQSQPCSQQPHV